MKCLCCCLAGVAVILSPAFGEKYCPPTLSAIAVETAPVLDGKLDDPCWREAFEVSDFHLLGKKEPATFPTAMLIVTSGDSLYLAFRCSKGKPPFSYTAENRAHDADIGSDDSVEVFIQPKSQGGKCYQFVVNPAGAQWEGADRDRSWDGPWKAAALKTDEGWSVEMAIPFSSLGAVAPAKDEAWGFSAGRNEAAAKEKSCWPDLLQGYNEPEKFGKLMFVRSLIGQPRLAAVSNDGAQKLYIAPRSARPEAEGIKTPAKVGGTESLNIVNPSFESGLEPWSLDYPTRAYGKSPVTQDSAVKTTGNSSACITSANPFARITVFQKIITPPSGRFEVECLLKLSDPAKRGMVLLFADEGGHQYRDSLALLSMVALDEDLPNGWIRRRVRFSVPAGCHFVRIGVEVLNYRGQVWVDNFTSHKAARPDRPIDGIWFWDGVWADDGSKAKTRIQNFLRDKPPFFERAQKFNDLLVGAACAWNDAKRLERARYYLGANADGTLDGRLKEIYSDLDCANRAYALAYVENKPDTLASGADALLKKTEASLDAVRGDTERGLKEAAAEAEKRFGRWTPANSSGDKPFQIAPDGKPNQLIFGTWGKLEYRALGRALDIWNLTSNDGVDRPVVNPAGVMSWEKLADYVKTVVAEGTPYFMPRTGVLIGRDTGVTAAFEKANKDKPDFILNRKWNLWNPAVIDEQRNMLATLTQQFRGNPAILCYQFAWEARGPQQLAPTDTDPAKSSGLASFQKYLRQTYGDIGKLNGAWKTNYADFAVIAPPRESVKPADPLRYDYECWRQASFLELLKTLYSTLKKEAPDKAVLSSHTSLINRIDPTYILETCDILDIHGPSSTPMALYVSGNAQRVGKQVCTFENFWSYQEDTPRWGDDRAQFAAMAKYLYRNTLLGQRLQFWCFPYTSQEGWNWRQAQWCQTATDYTTLRYAASALPMAKRRVKELDNVFLSTRPDLEPILVIFPRTSFLHLQDTQYVETVRTVAYLHDAGRSFAFRSEADIASGEDKLENYRLVVLLRSPFLADGMGDKLLGWVKAGGTLITLGPAGVYDKYGFEDGHLLREILGASAKAPTENWRGFGPWDFGSIIGAPSFVDRKAGKGQLFIVNMAFDDFILSEKDAAQLAAVIEEAVPRRFTCDTNDIELWPLVTEKGERLLGLLNMNSDNDVAFHLIIRDEVKRIADLSVAGGFPVSVEKAAGGTRVSLRLERGGMALLRLEK